MASQSGEIPIPASIRVGVSLLAAGVLAIAVVPLFATDGVRSWLVHPALVVGVVLTGQFWYVGRGLTTAATGRTAWSELVGLANALTVLRGGCYAVVAGFLVVPPETGLVWVPALCYGGGVVLDKVDGTVARTVGEETRLGERLDMAFDTFGFTVAPLLAVLWGRLPVWYLSLSAARYVFKAGLSWRRRRGRPVFDLPESPLRQALAGTQMVFLTVALVPTVPVALVWTVAPVVLAPSLALFARDFLLVTGRLGDRGVEST